MAAICKPEDAVVTQLVSTQTFTDTNGYYTQNQISLFQNEYVNALNSGIQTDPLLYMTDKYGSDAFFTTVGNINEYTAKPYIQDLLIETPDLNTLYQRVSQGPITPFEAADFMKEYNYDPLTLNEQLKSPTVIYQLQDYYTNGFANSFLGGLCSLMPKVFAGVGAFFGLIGLAGQAIADIAGFLNKIKNIENPLEAIFEKLKVAALIESFKNKITSMIEKTINKVKDAIKNFNIGNIMSDVATFVNNNIARQVNNLKENILGFFSKENIEQIIGKAKGLFDYGVGLFANPNIQEIQFLISRFCAMAAGIEDAIQALKNPLDSFANRFTYSLQRVAAAGNLNTASAIIEGRQVQSPAARNTEINNQRQRWIEAGNARRITDEDYKNLPRFEDLEAGGNGSGLYFDRSLTSWPRYDGEDGWKNSNIDLRVILMRVAKSFGTDLHINSPWRSQAHNTRVKGSSGSLHLSGNAFDISWRGYPQNRNEFLRIAYAEGFTGHGIYGGFVHIDLGNRVFTP